MGLTQEERELYSRLFKALDPESSGIVTGDKARATFEKSGLPANILGEIWQLADSKNLGFLTQFGFCHAMRLIGYTQAGQFPNAQLAETPGPLPKFADLPFSNQPLRSQSTSGSLLQAQPSSLIPQNTATQQSSPQAPIAPVSSGDLEKYSQMYVKTTGSAMAALDGNTAKLILMKAKLPTVVLGQIWSLVDVNNRGFLDLPSFVMAMHLIQGLLSGTLKQLPPFLPEYVWRSVDVPVSSSQGRQASYSSTNLQLSTIGQPSVQQPMRDVTVTGAPLAAPSEWQVSTLQKLQFESIFDNLDKSRSGSLAADQVASFLMTSRLDQQDLATIWDLADIQNTGIFSRLEFGIALFLINRRRAGLSLPDVVPEELISSLLQGLQVTSPPLHGRSGRQTPPVQPSLSNHVPPVKQKSSLDELADIFGSAGPNPATGSLAPISPKRSELGQRSSSSDLSHAREPPKMRQHLTSSFKPSSTFGQSLLANNTTQEKEGTDLIGETIASSLTSHAHAKGSRSSTSASNVPHPPLEPQLSSNMSSSENSEAKSKPVDYEALRSVPAPPQARPKNTASPAPNAASGNELAPAQRVANFTRAEGNQENNDLLADSEVSGRLSEATSDIANFSNQIKSLSTQTSNLHDKKIRAEKELARILSVKEEINSKLKLLRTSYASEVKQVEKVELDLQNAKEELEALRSEASIAEAKLNSVSNEFNEKQLAVEEIQKVNSSLREKLGNLNAEIAAVENEHQSKAAENVRLLNEASVRKSQAQVVLVKMDDLKHKISEVESLRENYQKEIEKFESQVRDSEHQVSELENLYQASIKTLEETKLKHRMLAGVAPGTGFREATHANEVSENTTQHKPENNTVVGKGVDDVAGVDLQCGEKDVVSPRLDGLVESSTFENEEINPQTGTTKFSVTGLVDEVKRHPATDLTGLDNSKDEGEEALSNSVNLDSQNEAQPSFSVAGMVDEVKRHPAADLTGVDDVKDVDHKATAFDAEEPEGLKQRFPPVPLSYENSSISITDFNSANSQQEFSKRASMSSAAADSSRQTDGGEVGETPITSPSNSEYRFQSSNAGVVGGMVGMPGVLVGVQRTDSLTSSVQNNPSMSVRDDNIDEVSDRDTLEDAAAFSHSPARNHKKSESRHEDSSEGERLSSGVELFELVNADEAKGVERAKSPQRAVDGYAHPLAQSYGAPDLSSGSGSQQIEEFPSPRELDYDESSSDESERDAAIEDKFDDANENFTSQIQTTPDYENEEDFDGLNPATEEVDEGNVHDEFFDEDFDNLKIADDDKQDEADTQHELTMDDHFTGVDNFGHLGTHHASPPDFSSPANEATNENDEWEQLFAGFGNATPAAARHETVQGGSHHDLAVQELVAMGFEKSAVVEILEKENYDVEVATNYLLDHA